MQQALGYGFVQRRGSNRDSRRLIDSEVSFVSFVSFVLRLLIYSASLVSFVVTRLDRS
jgi:hypothetical protein